MANFHLDFGKLDMLMSVERVHLTHIKVSVTATAAIRCKVMFSARFEHLLLVGLVAFLAAFSPLILFFFLFPGSPFKRTV
jgi:hypothetical protein